MRYNFKEFIKENYRITGPTSDEVVEYVRNFLKLAHHTPAKMWEEGDTALEILKKFAPDKLPKHGDRHPDSPYHFFDQDHSKPRYDPETGKLAFYAHHDEAADPEYNHEDEDHYFHL